MTKLVVNKNVMRQQPHAECETCRIKTGNKGVFISNLPNRFIALEELTPCPECGMMMLTTTRR